MVMQTDLIQDYAIPFAAWEMRLYLDTHPDDRRALAAYWDFCGQSVCKDNYACISRTACTCENWSWLEDPWPWEPSANPETREV
ncbi:MAG: spore coat protein CotJB [Clostridiales bacterium]|nr:spore coat protein CotJB [Clostridiales bacterium]